MRLVKLIAYSMLGYVLYELYLGMTETVSDSAPAAPRKSVQADEAGPKTVAVKDGTGARTKRVVGRGVVH